TLIHTADTDPNSTLSPISDTGRVHEPTNSPTRPSKRVLEYRTCKLVANRS
ncbi:hypothetical protein PIB30_036358, partial [Stylosanthes scabra]|nr:hypothetical protein [Stylosanthes scabra]